MEHPFFPTTTTRAEALRWLTIAEKLLSTRDLMGSKSFATRAREADPTLSQSDQILAVADTLLAGDMRIGNNHQDLYAILRLTPQQGRDAELIASQYRSLALLLNPQKNKFPFAEQAFRLVLDAWSVLSNPSRKVMYDRELAFYLHPQQQQTDPFGNPIPTMHQNFNFFGGSTSSSGGGGVAHISQPQHPVHFPQVQVPASSQVDPLTSGSAREAQNFMSFTSGSNIVFGSSSGLGSRSGSKSGHETLNRHAQESYTTFASNVTSAAVGTAPEVTQGQVNNEHNEQLRGNYSNVGDKTGQNVNVGENDGERADDEGDVEGIDGQEEGMDEPAEDGNLTFWTACPYCYYMYEYPRVYVDCTLRCQTCKSAFQAVVIPFPPPIEDGREAFFCCWGFMPMGFSMEQWEKNKGAASTWTPFSPMFTCPQPGSAAKNAGGKRSAPRIYVDDDEVFLEPTDSSGSDDDDWSRDMEKKKKKAKIVRGKGASGIPTPNRSVKKAQIDKGKNVDVQDGFVPLEEVETANKTDGDSSQKVLAVNARKQPGRAAKNFGKLDLNVECSNEAEEAAPRANQGNGPNRAEDDYIEGNGFFEGLDEFLSSLPILNVVGDDKVVKAA